MLGQSSESVPRAVGVLIIGLFLFYVAEPAFYWGSSRPGVPYVLAAAVGVLAFGATFIRIVRDSVRHGPGTNSRTVDLAVCGIVGFGVCFTCGPYWMALPAFFGGAALLSLSLWSAVTVGALALVGEALTGLMLGLSGSGTVEVTVRAGITALVVFALGRLGVLIREVHRARAELARMAVVQERLRFSRDLHDVLGHTLSVIALKSEVAVRLAARRPEQARQEMEAVVDIARSAITDVRTLVRGYRQPSLSAEIDGIRSVLETAGVTCEADAIPQQLPTAVQDVLGWVVREGATNVLRHSRASSCRIKVRISGDTVLLEILNDGAQQQAEGRPRRDGHGLVGLSERLAALDGRLAFGPGPGRTFRLRATVPRDPPNSEATRETAP
ncbi:sensor histidine kinase [Streptomyces sp. NPDC090798]|uniref:sensor histidine kinase n=1 Tax=Streptomyces sp. NPDC090798 TaxID=3365968 RepID=UPI00382A967F